MNIGILALQGDVREHKRALMKLDATPIEVKSPQDLEDLDALIIPGGESTTIGMLIIQGNCIVKNDLMHFKSRS